MAEIVEAPQSFQKTVRKQEKRLDDVEKLTGFIDRFTGKRVSGSLWASYAEGIGGQVNTHINSGRATLKQMWGFNRDGKLMHIRISEELVERDGKHVKIGEIRFVRDKNGRFQIDESWLGGVHSEKKIGEFMPPDILDDWAKEFQTAKARIETRRK